MLHPSDHTIHNCHRLLNLSTRLTDFYDLMYIYMVYLSTVVKYFHSIWPNMSTLHMHYKAHDHRCLDSCLSWESWPLFHDFYVQDGMCMLCLSTFPRGGGAHCARGRGSFCARDWKACASIRGEDTYVRLRQFWVFITKVLITMLSPVVTFRFSSDLLQLMWVHIISQVDVF